MEDLIEDIAKLLSIPIAVGTAMILYHKKNIAYFDKSEKLIGLCDVADTGPCVLRNPDDFEVALKAIDPGLSNGADAADFAGKGFKKMKVPDKIVPKGPPNVPVGAANAAV